jgi:hypothetical protein
MDYFNTNCGFYATPFMGDISAATQAGEMAYHTPANYWDTVGHGEDHSHPFIDRCLTRGIQSWWLRPLRT